MRITIFIFLLLLTGTAPSQTLKPGDKCPELKFINILNGKYGSVSLSTLRGKLILLDFGATTCLPCLRLMPALDSLQEKFGSDLAVFMVTKEKKDKVQAFLSNNKIAKRSKIPIIVEDSILNAMFPHKELPHEVWIDTSGKIAAITSDDYITFNNIDRILKGAKPGWPVKNDFDFEEAWSLWDYVKTQPGASKSVISGYLDGFNTQGQKGSVDASHSFRRYINFTLFDLYTRAYQRDLAYTFPAQFLSDSGITDRFFYKQSQDINHDQWKRNNSYCYEVSFSNSISDAFLYQKIRNDLDSYFGFRSSLQMKNIGVWVIKRSGATIPVSKKTDRSVRSAVYFLNSSGLFPLVINETKLSDEELGKFNIAFNTDTQYDESTLFKLFADAGFQLIRDKRFVEILSVEKR